VCLCVCAVAFLTQGIFGVPTRFIFGAVGGLRGEAMTLGIRIEQAGRDFASTAATASQSDDSHTPPWTRLESIDKLTTQISAELQALQADARLAATDFEPIWECHASFVATMMAIDSCMDTEFLAKEQIIFEHLVLQSTLEQAARDLRSANDWHGRLQHRIESMEKTLKDKARELQALRAARVQAAIDLVEQTQAAVESTKVGIEEAIKDHVDPWQQAFLEQEAKEIMKALEATEQKAKVITKELYAIAGELHLCAD